MMNIILDTATSNDVMVDHVDFADEIGCWKSLTYYACLEWLTQLKLAYEELKSK